MGNHRVEIRHLLAQRTSEKEKTKTENKTKQKIIQISVNIT